MDTRSQMETGELEQMDKQIFITLEKSNSNSMTDLIRLQQNKLEFKKWLWI